MQEGSSLAPYKDSYRLTTLFSCSVRVFFPYIRRTLVRCRVTFVWYNVKIEGGIEWISSGRFSRLISASLSCFSCIACISSPYKTHV